MTFLMDVKGAFPSVAKGNLSKRMEDMVFEADACRWVEGFMLDGKVVMRINGREGRVMGVVTRVPQASPVSLVLFVIYISYLFSKMEDGVVNMLALSFVNNVAWVVEADKVTQSTQIMQQCAEGAGRWP